MSLSASQHALQIRKDHHPDKVLYFKIGPVSDHHLKNRMIIASQILYTCHEAEIDVLKCHDPSLKYFFINMEILLKYDNKMKTIIYTLMFYKKFDKVFIRVR